MLLLVGCKEGYAAHKKSHPICFPSFPWGRWLMPKTCKMAIKTAVSV